jgi:hypothetical protein
VRRFSFVTALVLAVGLAACNKGQNQAAQNQPANVTSGDPADGNLAPTGTPAASPSGESYAPAPPSDQQSDQQYAAPETDQNYEQSASYEQPVQASEPPPSLPDYEQPPAPGDDYVWTPGYWAYANAGYYWVPGAWVLAPYVGALWTPPWWGFDNGAYLWHAGYWAPHIGFYGGIDYGFGYTGHGYYGAYWNNGRLDYNRAVTNVDPSVVHYVYNYNVPNSRPGRVSYNGGRGGIDVRPTTQELAVQREARTPAVPAQVQHAREASSNRAQFVKPGVEAPKPAALVAARPLPTNYKTPAARPPAPPAASHGPLQATRQEAAPRPAPRPEARPESRPEARPPAPPAQAARPPAPVTRAPQNGAVARREATPAPAARPAPHPEARPAAARPAPEARSEARPAPPRPAPQAHPAPRPQAHPAPRPAPKKEEERK